MSDSDSEHKPITEIDFVSYGLADIGLSVDNLIEIINVESREFQGKSIVSNQLLLAILQGMLLQINELGKRVINLGILYGNSSSIEDASLQDRLIQSSSEIDKLQVQIKEQQEHIRLLESEERLAGFKTKITRMEIDLEDKAAKLAYYEEFERLLHLEKKRAKKDRKDLGVLKERASRNVASKINRSHDECNTCLHQDALPPVCTGHVQGNTSCKLFTCL